MAEAAAVADKGGAAAGAGAQGGAGAGAGDDKGAAATFTKQAQVGDAGAGVDAGKGAKKGDAGNTEAAWPQDWRDQLAGGDEKLVKRAQRYASPRDVWNALVAAQNRISSGELKSVLPKDAKPEEIAAWRAENGIPETPDKYELPAEVAKGVDKGTLETFTKVAHAHNLPATTVQAVIEWSKADATRRRDELTTADQTFRQESEDALRAAWGNDFRSNLNMIDALLATAPPELTAQLAGARLANGKPLGADPMVMKWLAQMAREINPPTTLVGVGAGDIGASIETELAKIKEFRRTNRKAYMKDEAMQQRERDLLDAQIKAKGKAA